MTPITIALNDEQIHDLSESAGELGLSVEDLIQKSIEDYLARRKKIQSASEYVLKKNAELYQRLA